MSKKQKDGWFEVSRKKANKEIDLPEGENTSRCKYRFYYDEGKLAFLFVEGEKAQSTLYSLEGDVGEVVGTNMARHEASAYVQGVMFERDGFCPSSSSDKVETKKSYNYMIQQANMFNLATAGELILKHFDIDHQGVAKTPERYANALIELLKGYDSNPLDHVRIFDDVKTSSIIIAKDVSFFSMCEHHMLPFFGTVSMGYIPKDDKVIGASKLARIFDCFACQLQVQERIGEQFCDFIEEQLHPLGVICLIKATHLCIASRGVKKETASFVTNAVRGVFLTDPAARAEFMSMVK